MNGNSIELAFDGEVFCWNPKRGIPRVYREIVSRISSVDPNIKPSLHVQGRMADEGWDRSNVRIEQVPALSRSLKPWSFWQHVTPRVNRDKARKYWAAVGADLFHSTHYSMPTVDGPMFCTVHDMMPELFPDSFEPGARNAITVSKREAVSRAALVLCVSENTRQDLIRLLRVPEQKCRVVHNGGFDVDQINEDLALGCAAVTDRPFLLYVGGWRMPYKNFNFIIESLCSRQFCELDEYQLVVASPEAPSQRERQHFESVLHGRGVRFMHNCDDRRLTELYLSCSALVMPSRYEGFGLPVIEALACGAPVASSCAASLPEVGGQAACYFDPASRDEFKTALDQALREGRTPGAVRARREHARRFSWDKATVEFCRAARDIVEGKQER